MCLKSINYRAVYYIPYYLKSPASLYLFLFHLAICIQKSPPHGVTEPCQRCYGTVVGFSCPLPRSVTPKARAW